MVEISDRYQNQVIKVNLIWWAVVQTCQVQEPLHIQIVPKIAQKWHQETIKVMNLLVG